MKKKPDWRAWLKDKEECRAWLDSYMKKGIIRKGSYDYKLHLRKSDHDKSLADWLLAKHNDSLKKDLSDTFYDWPITIYYYAIYHAALALMVREGHSSKNHSATLCFLIYHHYHLQKAIEKEDVELIAGSFGKEDIEMVGTSKEVREKACYDVTESFQRGLAEGMQKDASNFINRIKEMLAK